MYLLQRRDDEGELEPLAMNLVIQPEMNTGWQLLTMQLEWQQLT